MTMINKIFSCVILCCAAMLASSCDNYLDIKPKGDKIPTTLADYEALLRGETILNPITHMPSTNALLLLNDIQRNKSLLNTHNLAWANYMWQEDADRIKLNNADENFLLYTYGGIASCNLILDGAPSATDCTPAERNEVMAYARTIRAYNYLMLVNYYADTYTEATASTKLGVPVVLSSEPNAHHRQWTVGEIYDFVISEIKECLDNNYLPEPAMTILHPGRAAAHAILARTYLMMSRFADAKAEAEAALADNDALYNWNDFYDANKAKIETPTNFAMLPSPAGYSFPETLFFRQGECLAPGVQLGEPNMNLERGDRFEEGDAKFMSRWKKRKLGLDTYYNGMLRGFHNLAGITTVEMYLIKAECLAREGKVTEAMDVLNKVRQTRIRPEVYQPMTASDVDDAVNKIRDRKDNELVMTLVPFLDARRLNAEGKYARTMTKVVDGVTYTLRPDSHLWTMTFPANAMNNSGNGNVVQNSK